MGLLEIAKANGASDADIEALKPFLEKKLFGNIEEDITGLDAAKETARQAEIQRLDWEKKAADAEKRVSEWTDWSAQAQTAFDTLQKQAMQARENEAKYRERLKAAKEYGFGDLDDTPIAPKEEPKVEPLLKTDLPDLNKYVSKDEISDFGKLYGKANAMATDIAEEHRELFGTRVNMTTLYDEAVKEGKSMEEMWKRKYDVDGARQRQAKALADAEEKRRQDEVAAIRADERKRVLSEIGNPATSPAMPSRFPSFLTKDQNGEKPWDSTGAIKNRSNERASKVLTTLAKTGAA